jgi:GH24 family phage-related lysozyme (muramidase)
MIKTITMAVVATLLIDHNGKYISKIKSRPIETTIIPDDKLYNTAALFIKSKESLRLKPYRCSGGHLTVGWGHAIRNKAEHHLYSNGISVKQANKLFDIDYAKSIREVKRSFPKLKSHRKIIITSMIAFNIGMNFADRGLGKAIKCGYDIEPYLLQYRNADGRVSKGLIRRRRAELELWNASRCEFIAAADGYKDDVNKKIRQAYQSI